MKRKLMSSTVIRLQVPGIEPSVVAGSVWLMNRKETGWSSHGFPYPTLAALLDEWELSLGKCGSDEHGTFIEAHPVTAHERFTQLKELREKTRRRYELTTVDGKPHTIPKV